jgi:hypothetical protein
VRGTFLVSTRTKSAVLVIRRKKKEKKGKKEKRALPLILDNIPKEIPAATMAIA